MSGSRARICAVLLLISRTHGKPLVALTDDLEHAVPTPDGYTFNLHDVDQCYRAPSNVPPGYNFSTGEKCVGEPINTWDDGTPSHWGMLGDRHAWTDFLECSRTCNGHKECAGFFAVDGICSHWVRNIQDHPQISGYDCYTKWHISDQIFITDHEPTPPEPVPEPAKDERQISDCLCIFDVDRTLTAKQINAVGTPQFPNDCPGTKEFPDLFDAAYNGGAFILSEMALRRNESFCGQCYFGIVSAGTASGPKSKIRDLIESLVDPKYNVGGYVDGCPTPAWGTKMMCCGEGDTKGQAARDIVTWMNSKGIKIRDDKVHFFDDKSNNIDGLKDFPFNAHQISCGSRDGSRGRCGGTFSEIVDTPGQHYCEQVI